MAWNDKGGGPWGSPPSSGEPRRPSPSNGKGPVGKGPNDFEDDAAAMALNASAQWWPGFRGGLGILIVVAVVLVIWMASRNLYASIRTRKPSSSGSAHWRARNRKVWHYHLPTPIETVTIVDVTSRHQTEIGSRNSRESTDAGTMLTGDSNIVELGFVIVWQVRDPVKYLFKVADPDRRAAARGGKRDARGDRPDGCSIGAQRRARADRNQFGRHPAKHARPLRFRHPESRRSSFSGSIRRSDVVDAFHDVQRARAELEQQRNDAEKYRNDILPRARGEAQQVIQDAGGYKDKTIAEATGEAAQFISVLDAYKVARDVTARRLYIETMETILQHSRKIIIDPNADSKNGVVPYLPLPALNPPTSPAKVQ